MLAVISQERHLANLRAQEPLVKVYEMRRYPKALVFTVCHIEFNYHYEEKNNSTVFFKQTSRELC